MLVTAAYRAKAPVSDNPWNLMRTGTWIRAEQVFFRPFAGKWGTKENASCDTRKLLNQKSLMPNLPWTITFLPSVRTSFNHSGILFLSDTVRCSCWLQVEMLYNSSLFWILVICACFGCRYSYFGFSRSCLLVFSLSPVCPYLLSSRGLASAEMLY